MAKYRTKTVGELKPGDKFKYCGYNYVIVDHNEYIKITNGVSFRGYSYDNIFVLNITDNKFCYFSYKDSCVEVEIPQVKIRHLDIGKDFEYQDKKYMLQGSSCPDGYCYGISLEDSDRGNRVKNFCPDSLVTPL